MILSTLWPVPTGKGGSIELLTGVRDVMIRYGKRANLKLLKVNGWNLNPAVDTFGWLWDFHGGFL